MKNRLSLILFLIAFLSFAQNKFESGYYIDNSGVKTECLIKNYDWKNNPKNIETKTNLEDNVTTTKSIEEINEFAITGKSKFVKATVNIDESSQNLVTLTNSPSPKFVEKTVLLKVLVQGNSNLYYFVGIYSSLIDKSCSLESNHYQKTYSCLLFHNCYIQFLFGHN